MGRFSRELPVDYIGVSKHASVRDRSERHGLPIRVLDFDALKVSLEIIDVRRRFSLAAAPLHNHFAALLAILVVGLYDLEDKSSPPATSPSIHIKFS
jgi:hypothetical protein